jgi:RNA polymerase sigma-70 factor (ECF subfamily)
MGRNASFGILQAVTNAPIEDTELISRFQKGDRAAFSLLFQRHQPSVARLIARMLGEPYRRRSQVVELEDLVQDVFVQIYRSLATFRGNSKVTTWIYRIAVNVVLMHRRSARARPVFSPDDDAVPPVAPDLTADDELVRQTNVRALYRLLSQISEKKRTVYILHEIEGLSASEVADVVSAPVLTVRTRLFYARRELASLLRNDPHLATVLEELETEERRMGKRTHEQLSPKAEDADNSPVSLHDQTANGGAKRS